MTPSRRDILTACGFALLATGRILPARAAPALKVVATFSILADFARNVGGDRVAVTSLVGANGDSHVYTPTPDDARRVADAALVMVNGFGLEGWLPRLVKAAGGRARLVTATAGIAPRKTAPDEHAEHEVDPHAWQSVANAKIYVGNIRDALIAADPAGAEAYRANAAGYLERLEALDAEVRAAVAQIPPARRKVISTHDAFGYFARDYGVAFIAPQGVSTEADIGAADLAGLIRQIRAEKIPAVFLENLSDQRLMRQIAAETGARIGGTLYSDALTAENGEAPTYIDLVRHNIKTLTGALAG
ncbi:metal ABC transporter substrate-binding protein [Bradyrhizobium sp. WD16]|uniref:metal ABC transporter substrate-binding protein n=1 Tax=Bradyrhizobium sp. WD16 TaxID=1521768 RepID=UPI0020A3692B|nr:metal ABC transporter substrate-binding protein [Bradyrhizobium sp. WD16]UTD27655.1 ABC transporter substrate-binding protein [Bradyrhizobium sp. WD16]